MSQYLFLPWAVMFDSFALAIEATFNARNWFDNSRLNDLSYGLADLNSPNVLAGHVSVLEVWACAQPSTC